jgi:hypothetical protein
VVAWAILFVAVPPGKQDFPLIDDWAFARGAFLFAGGQGTHYADFASMPQLGQWLWACPFIWVWGDSCVALRISTILLSWLGLLAFFDLLSNEGFPPGRAAFTTAILAFNPVFFLLQGTFMTDVPALSFALISLALYTRALRGSRPALLVAAAAVAILGALTRQNAIAAPIAAGVLLWRSPTLRWRRGWLLAVLLPCAVAIVTDAWFRQHGDNDPTKPELPSPANIFVVSFVALHFSGLSAIPVLALQPRPASWKAFGSALLFMAVGALYCWRQGTLLVGGGLFPYLDGVLTPHGAYSAATVVGHRPLLMTRDTQMIASIAGCLAGAWLLARLVSRKSPTYPPALGGARITPSPLMGEPGPVPSPLVGEGRDGGPRPVHLGPLLLFTIVQAFLLLFVPMLYDRYLIMLLPGALYVAGTGGARSGYCWLASALLATCLAILSICLMHDWLAWNAARWELGRRTLARGIPARDIEGGLEWDGWHAPLRWSQRDAQRPPFTGFLLPITKGHFPHVRGRYALSFSPFSATLVRDSEAYTQWLPPGRRQFFLLESRT